ncbi:Mn-dependent transcriptional regulator MntR [hydrothermal vent metagenome]|uniref:Manganese transport regulator n=1 Tax=hydrothermal vent metagenome TaxID=652676 RepID=A0A3B1E4Y7_9ZZZZ
MPSLVVENYLKGLYQIGQRANDDWVPTGKLAEALKISPGSATSMLKSLAEETPPLVQYKAYQGVKLSKAGEKIALRVLRRHRLIELFLVTTLSLSWDQVHEEAENMEHAVSDMLVDRIDEFLGHPTSDPHGDPIPSRTGEMRTEAIVTMPLSSCNPSQEVELVRVIKQDATFLQYLSQSKMTIGSVMTVIENNPTAEIITLQIGKKIISLGHPAAESLLVKLIKE